MPVGTEPFASTIMQADDAATWVGRAIGSWPAESLPDWQLIVGDDGNTDRATDIVSGFHDNRIEPIRTSSGNGPGGARNLALDHTIGGYLVPLDADDALHPDRLNVLSRWAESRGADTILIDRCIRSLQDPYLAPEPVPPARYRSAPSQEFVVGSTAIKSLMSATLVERRNARYSAGAIAGEDCDFIVLLLDGGGQSVQVDAPMYGHRLRADSWTRSSATAIHDGQSSVLNVPRQRCSDLLVIESLAARQARIKDLYAVSEIVEGLRDRRIGRIIHRLRQRPCLIMPTMKRLVAVLRYRIGRGKIARDTS